jgi:predicted nucleotidyltransferase
MEPTLKERAQAAIKNAMQDITSCYPKAVLLFGSMARYLQELDLPHKPGDIDLVVVSDNPLLDIAGKDYGFPIEIHKFRTEEIIAIAKSLRYDPKPVALSKLYSKNVIKQHSRDVFTAAMLLGPGYNEFGIEQIEIEGQLDTRDYSIHRVLHGNKWWHRLTEYAREHRGPLRLILDKAWQLDRFSS